MVRSTDRFLTTHTGSLPRPDDLVRMMFAKEEGVPVDAAALARAGPRGGRRDCQEAGRGRGRYRQRRRDVEAELCHLCEGPADGFGGTGNTYVFQDLEAFPEERRTRVWRSRAASAARRPACNAPIN